MRIVMTGATAGFGLFSASSKLCNIMTAREAAKRYPSLSVMAFDPGYVPHTALGRDNPTWVATLVSYILPLVMKRDRSSMIPRSGQFLADLAVNDRFANSHGSYWAVRGRDLLEIDSSVVARDDAAWAALWEDSAKLVGLSCD